MKTLGRTLGLLGATLAIVASYLNNSGNGGPVDFLRGLACGLLFSAISIQVYHYIQNRKEKALEKADI